MANSKKTYRITFHNQGKIYEIYAKSVHQSDLFGFIEVEQIVFGEKSSLLVDPSEERLKTEFSGVKRTYIPMHAVVRIDDQVGRLRDAADPVSDLQGVHRGQRA